MKIHFLKSSLDVVGSACKSKAVLVYTDSSLKMLLQEMIELGWGARKVSIVVCVSVCLSLSVWGWGGPGKNPYTC